MGRWNVRAQFLLECEEVLDPLLLDEASLHHAGFAARGYLVRLTGWATDYAGKKGATRIVQQRQLETADASDEIEPTHQARFVASAPGRLVVGARPRHDGGFSMKSYPRKRFADRQVIIGGGLHRSYTFEAATTHAFWGWWQPDVDRSEMTSARQRGQNPVGSFGHAHFWQDMDIVAQKRIDLDEAVVFRNRLGETMPSSLV